MKIYPNNSNIMVTTNVNTLTDIPLSYVDTEKLTYRINTVIESNFRNKIKQEVLPYENMNKNLICLFDKYGNLIDHTELTKHFKREGDNYVFIPYGSTIFNPKTFEYNVIAKKSMVYNSKMQYDLKVCVMSEPLANSLMPIFGDAPSKKLAPSNILINSGSMSYSDLVTSNTKDKDIAFINLITPTIDEQDNEFDSSTILKGMTNVFAFMSNMYSEEVTENTTLDNTQVKLYTEKDEVYHDYKLKKAMIYDEVTLSSNKFFSVPKNKEGIKYHNIFNSSNKTPILIEEHEGQGFVIYAINDILYQSALYSQIFYEVMFYVYSKSYVQTKQYTEWITDEIPEYIVVNNKLTKKDKFMSQLELHKMFGLNECEVVPYSINIDKEKYPYVKFTGLTNNYLTFEKDTTGSNDAYKDPVKDRDAISIYTSRQDVLYFNNFLYKIDDSLEENIKVERINNNINVTIKPFRHSSTGIYVKTLTSLDIPLTYTNHTGNEIQITNADYYIVCKNNESASYLEYIDVTSYSKKDGEILATIQIRQDKTEILVYDMRQRGGGLPESEKDNYNCFDIGHIFGRPYRKGGSFIITLPMRLKEYKSMIEETVKQYCAAEEYPIIIFEEEK